jgi:hypothetical protein
MQILGGEPVINLLNSSVSLNQDNQGYLLIARFPSYLQKCFILPKNRLSNKSLDFSEQS